MRGERRSICGTPSGECGVTGDEARAALDSEVSPRPFGQYEETIAEADEEEDVNEEPGEPGDESREMDLADLGDGFVAADGRHGSFVPIGEGLARLACDVALDGRGCPLAHLDGDGR